MIIGITGGSGAGKSTLLQLIADMGGLVLDCDAIYHELLAADKALLAAIGARFPGTVGAAGLNRKKLGSMVFSDEKALQELNAITHGAVKREVLRRLESKPALAAIDAIALHESGLAELCQVTVAVIAPREQRIRRLMVREGISRDYAEKRIAAQKSDAYFSSNCDETLENNGDKEAFFTKCIAFFQRQGIIK